MYKEGLRRSIIGTGTVERNFQLHQKRVSFKYELSQGSEMLLSFNREIQYVLKNMVNYFVFIKVLIFQNSEGHMIVLEGKV